MLLCGQDAVITVPAEPGIGLVSPYAEIKTYLSLTDQQLTALQEVQRSRQQADEAIYKQINDKQVQLSQLLNANSTDALAIGRLMVEINNLRRQVPTNQGPYRENAVKVLTPPQVAKLPALVQALQLSRPAWEATSLNLIDDPNNSGGVTPLPFPVDPRIVSSRP